MEKMRFNNDYNHGAHPAVLKAFVDTNDNSYSGYSTDEVCSEATEAIRKYLKKDSIVHYVVGGTQANVYGLLAGLTRPHYSVISPDSGHINVHEAGSIEHVGHKIQQIPNTDGKVTAEQVAKEAEIYRATPMKDHITEPKMVYISLPTEYGSTYTLAELEAIRAVCDEYGLYLFVDGARLGYGLAAKSCDVTMEDLARLTDAFYIGGTKCGAMFGEALVLNNPELNIGFRNLLKTHGALMAKGWTFGLQFKALFEDGLYFEITERAVRMADRINEAFKAKGINQYIPADTNQLFYVLTDEQIEKLEEKFIFEEMDPIDGEHQLVRFCTSWSTTEEEVEALIEAVNNL